MPINLWPSYFNLCISIVAFLLTSGIAVYAWFHRNLLTAKNIDLFSFIRHLMVSGLFGEIVSSTVYKKLIFENIQYLALSLALLCYLDFTLAYTNRLQKRSFFFWVLLLIEPIINQVIIWMDPTLHLFRAATFIQTSGMTYPGMLNSSYGPWFWVNLSYTLVFFSVILILLIINFFTSPKWTRARYGRRSSLCFYPFLPHLFPSKMDPKFPRLFAHPLDRDFSFDPGLGNFPHSFVGYCSDCA
jgi:hypothetical protein